MSTNDDSSASFEQTTENIETRPDNILKNPIVDGLNRAMVILRNPNWPINRILRHSSMAMQHHHRLNQVRSQKVRKKYVSKSLCIACVYLQVNTNADDESAGGNPNERALNPVIGAIETAGKLAQLLVQIGEQVLPGLIANITLDNPAGLDRMGLEHNGRPFVRALVNNPYTDSKPVGANQDASSAVNDNFSGES